jgi:hypothetical protein
MLLIMTVDVVVGVGVGGKEPKVAWEGWIVMPV